MEKVEQLVQFLGRLNSGENPASLENEYRQLLALTEPADLALAEQRLLESGMATYEFCGLCEKITNLLGDQVAILRGRLSAGHPMQRIFFQHKRYLRILDNLEELNTSLANVHPAWAGCPEYKRLRNLAQDVDWAQRHTAAEQNVLLPEIEQHGNIELTKIIKFQHADIEEGYHKLKTLIGSLNNMAFEDVKQQFSSVVQWLVPVGRMHIVVEENVFYPIASSLIEGKTTWDKFLAICNQPEQMPAPQA